LDLYIDYRDEKYPIELKLWRGEKSLEKGLTQTARYVDILGKKHGYLCMFNRNSTAAWKEKIYMRDENVDGKIITVVGL
jgi:hypothetical protein